MGWLPVNQVPYAMWFCKVCFPKHWEPNSFGLQLLFHHVQGSQIWKEGTDKIIIIKTWKEGREARGVGEKWVRAGWFHRLCSCGSLCAYFGKSVFFINETNGVWWDFRWVCNFIDDNVSFYSILFHLFSAGGTMQFGVQDIERACQKGEILVMIISNHRFLR